MIHYNGGGSCEKPITDKLYKKRYNSCRAAAIAGESVGRLNPLDDMKCLSKKLHVRFSLLLVSPTFRNATSVSSSPDIMDPPPLLGQMKMVFHAGWKWNDKMP